jgi:hypothetical protein
MANLGSITINEIELIEVDVSPRTSGVDASTGSLAILTDGTFAYLKTGNNNIDWASIGIEYNYRITTANQTSTSTTYANVTELVSESLLVGTYRFECFAICQSTAANTGVGVRIGAGTATLGATFGKWDISQAANGIDKNFQYDQLNSTTNVTSTSVATANTDFVVTGRGIVTLSTAGTIAIQFRSETTTASSIRIGSIFCLKKII